MKLPARHQELWNVVIETPRGSRNKYKQDEELGVLRLVYTLPAGYEFPFDFGFIPGTRAGDGDPLDVLVLLEEPVFPGCLVRARLLGVLEAVQGEGERNDRVLAVAEQARHRFELDPRLLADLQNFFETSSRQRGKPLRVLGFGGPERAEEIARAACLET